MFRFMIIALLFISASAHAYTSSTCNETWYAPVQGHEFAGRHDSWKKIKEGICQDHHETLLKVSSLPRDEYTDESGSEQSEMFVMIDGNGYYKQSTSVHQGPYCGGGDVPGLDPQCFLPRVLRHYETHHYNEYYQVTTKNVIHSVPGCDAEYATDGRSVFFLTTDFDDIDHPRDDTPFKINNASANTFRCFSPKGWSGRRTTWANDNAHVFFNGRIANGMSPNYATVVFENVLLFGVDLAVNGDHVFSFDYVDGVKLALGIGPNLRFLSRAFFTDEKNVYDNNLRKIDRISPEKFAVVHPVCPAPGHPDIKCTQPSRTQNEDGGFGIQGDELIIPSSDGIRRMTFKGLTANNAIIVLKYEDFDSRARPVLVFKDHLCELH